jgi:hypothetical protein
LHDGVQGLSGEWFHHACLALSRISDGSSRFV